MHKYSININIAAKVSRKESSSRLNDMISMKLILYGGEVFKSESFISIQQHNRVG